MLLEKNIRFSTGEGSKNSNIKKVNLEVLLTMGIANKV